MYSINGKPLIIEDINETPEIIGSYERAVDGTLISYKVNSKRSFHISAILEEDDYNFLKSLLGGNATFYNDGESVTVYVAKINGKRIKGTTVYEVTADLLEV
jgi:hypothetical protein